jgi:hypothetical protein
MNFLNKEKVIEVSSSITEYDISSANTSIIRHFGLLSNSIVDKLEKMPKIDRVKAVGKVMKKYRDFSKNLEEGFNKIITEFIELNNLDESDIISIKRDAVFVINKDPKVLNIGEHIHFIPKNSYTDYLYCRPYEIYRNKEGLEIKGMNDEIKERVKNGMPVFFNALLDTCIQCGMQKRVINEFMSDFANVYKNRKLDFDFYRELNTGYFKLIFRDHEVTIDYMDEETLEKIDISYNYLKIVLPLQRNIC